MPTPASPSVRLLLVDDNKYVRSGVRRMLMSRFEPGQVQIDLADDGEAAWKRLQQGDIQLAVIDMQMPVLDGLSLIGRIRADARFDALKLVGCSGVLDGEQVLKAGADAFVEKPFDMADVVDVIAELLLEAGIIEAAALTALSAPR